jgi:hypothetical protein
MRCKITLVFLALLVLSSCNNRYRYFTQDLYSEFDWTEDDLSRIQFFVSEDIYRIERGTIKIVDGSEVEEIIIERGTPGVFVQAPKSNRFAISFEKDESNFLMFGPNPKANGRFVLLAKDWERRRGQVTYGGKIYETPSSSAYAALMVDIRKARKVNYKSRKASGNRVN